MVLVPRGIWLSQEAAIFTDTYQTKIYMIPTRAKVLSKMGEPHEKRMI